MNLAHYISHLTHSNLVADLDLTHLDNLPFYIYIKDLDGKYLALNNTLVKDWSLSSQEDAIGLSDSDLAFLPHNEALKLRSHDQHAIMQEKSTRFIEPVTLGDGAKVRLLSYKMALLTKTQKSLGMIGISLIQDRIDDSSSIDLSPRQLTCLTLLVKGNTLKQIANQLNLSPRTVEHYIETIKLKLRCESRSDLISKALQLPVIKDKI